MKLKAIIDILLRDQNRSLSWLAAEMNKTFDGLKLSLVKESIKYIDIKRMAVILDVPAACFFKEEDRNDYVLAEEKVEYSSLKTELAACKELVETLKSQISDKERIINLLSEKR